MALRCFHYKCGRPKTRQPLPYPVSEPPAASSSRYCPEIATAPAVSSIQASHPSLWYAPPTCGVSVLAGFQTPESDGPGQGPSGV